MSRSEKNRTYLRLIGHKTLEKAIKPAKRSGRAAGEASEFKRSLQPVEVRRARDLGRKQVNFQKTPR